MLGESWRTWASRHEMRCDKRYEDIDRKADEARGLLHQRIEATSNALNIKLDSQTAEMNAKLDANADKMRQMLFRLGMGIGALLLTIIGMLLHKNGVL